ncbi:unnamed protein product [Amoebophrya sp. A25]|nr:unnamed protein product [Amoebophrya sp. A25]|eukprot:GSA25T00010071001.1
MEDALRRGKRDRALWLHFAAASAKILRKMRSKADADGTGLFDGIGGEATRKFALRSLSLISRSKLPASERVSFYPVVSAYLLSGKTMPNSAAIRKRHATGVEGDLTQQSKKPKGGSDANEDKRASSIESLTLYWFLARCFTQAGFLHERFFWGILPNTLLSQMTNLNATQVVDFLKAYAWLFQKFQNASGSGAPMMSLAGDDRRVSTLEEKKTVKKTISYLNKALLRRSLFEDLSARQTASVLLSLHVIEKCGFPDSTNLYPNDFGFVMWSKLLTRFGELRLGELLRLARIFSSPETCLSPVMEAPESAEELVEDEAADEHEPKLISKCDEGGVLRRGEGRISKNLGKISRCSANEFQKISSPPSKSKPAKHQVMIQRDTCLRLGRAVAAQLGEAARPPKVGSISLKKTNAEVHSEIAALLAKTGLWTRDGLYVYVEHLMPLLLDSAEQQGGGRHEDDHGDKEASRTPILKRAKSGKDSMVVGLGMHRRLGRSRLRSSVHSRRAPSTGKPKICVSAETVTDKKDCGFADIFEEACNTSQSVTSPKSVPKQELFGSRCVSSLISSLSDLKIRDRSLQEVLFHMSASRSSRRINCGAY